MFWVLPCDMPVLNHHIVATGDKEATARFFVELLGLPEAFRLDRFAVVRVSDDTTLDFIDKDDDFRWSAPTIGESNHPTDIH